METTLADILEYAETWPKEAQERLISYAESIEKEVGGVYRLTEDDIRCIEKSREDFRNGRIATDEEVAAALNPYR
jgi:hypothetical protein